MSGGSSAHEHVSSAQPLRGRGREARAAARAAVGRVPAQRRQRDLAFRRALGAVAAHVHRDYVLG